MKQPASPGVAAFLRLYSAEVLRWNRRINLVSRRETESLLEDLFAQSLEGGRALWGLVEEMTRDQAGNQRDVLYFDLGSGGGIPGTVWHCLFSERNEGLKTWLVEPREKRAWFLERMSGLAQTPEFSVCCGRWGETGPLCEPRGSAPTVLISLKALHLSDDQVLGGLAQAVPALESARVVIARYYPASQVLDQALVGHLGIPAVGASRSFGSLQVEGDGSRVLSWSAPGPRAACLVLSLYR